ncbi:MAG: M23 family metallopeptidase [Acidobacteriota bacterium]
MTLYARRSRRSRPWGKILLALLLVLGLSAVALAWLRVGPPPTLSIEPELPGIGPRTPVVVHLAEPTRGLASWRAELVQGERVVPLEGRSYTPRPFWAFWGTLQAEDTVRFDVGRETLPELSEGTATLRLVAERATTPLRRPEPTVRELELPVRLRAPALQVTREPYLVAEGGSGVVIYRVGAEATRDGVQVGDHFVPGSPFSSDGSEVTSAGGERLRFAFYGVADDFTERIGDAEPTRAIRLVAEDELGNRIEQPFLQSFLERRFTSDDIEVDDGFLARVVPPIVARTAEIDEGPSLVETYVTINRELRARNVQTLVDLAMASHQEMLWRGSFLQLPNSVVTGTFGDRRTYFYGGEEIDRATHLGFDLASVREAEVPSANAGVVVLADFFGIYGNTVVVDHGFGVLSLYSHLSRIDVEAGATVDRSTILGRTGTTGLAAGDHLHFTMIVGGVQVTPLEWWDRGWIANRIREKLADTFDLGADAG